MISAAALISSAVTLLLALAAAWAVLMPFFSRETAKLPQTAGLSDFIAGKEAALAALEDLEADFINQKISEEDYRSRRTELMHAAARNLSAIDRCEEEQSGGTA